MHCLLMQEDVTGGAGEGTIKFYMRKTHLNTQTRSPVCDSSHLPGAFVCRVTEVLFPVVHIYPQLPEEGDRETERPKKKGPFSGKAKK